MSLTSKQWRLIVALVAVGAVASGLVLWRDADHASDATDAHEHHEEHEGRDADSTVIALTEAQRQAAGIVVSTVAAGRIQTTHEFSGEIRFNEDRTAHVVPRLGGVVVAVPATLGQPVRAGQVLAVVASTALSELRSDWRLAQRRLVAAQVAHAREERLWKDKISAEQDYLAAQSTLHEAQLVADNARQKLHALGVQGQGSDLSRFELRAPFDGTVVEKHIAQGEAVQDDSNVFTVSDLRTVWAEFAVAAKDLAVVRVGQPVVVSSSALPEQVQGTISYVGALLGEQTRTARARVTLANPQGAWRPGLFVTVKAMGPAQDAAVVVPVSAIQTVEGQPTVFKAVEGGFMPTTVTVGRSDGRVSELINGLNEGDVVATTNAYVLKSELAKASAEHVH